MCISDAPSEGPSAVEAAMIKSRDTQDTGSNEASKEENKFEEERETANLGNRKQKKSLCTCPLCRTMMILQECR